MDRPLTERLRDDGAAVSLDAYRKAGGYEAVRAVVGKKDPEEVQREVKDALLRGRGGAGFGTAMKWGFVPLGDDAPHPKYLVANADEMEPGAFKDRLLLEGDPHQLLEGMILSAWAIGADVGYVFLRWAYREAEQRLRHAMAEAEEAGLIGADVLGSGWDFPVYLHVSAGRYMCGEETGLLNALEGKRATPRDKPPYPQQSGLWGKPTIVNNVETLCCVPHVIRRGAEWFRGISRSEKGGGTKLYGVSGRVQQPGLWELPLGTPMREMLEDHAGGMREGYALRGVLPGGGSTDFLVPEQLDTPLDYEHVQEAGSRLGTGTLIVLDDRTCPVGMVANLERFFAQESCGWCTPCREGLPWTARILRALEEGEGRHEDLDHLRMHTQFLGPGNTFCALAPGAVEPLQSALEHFEDDFRRHVDEGGCPYGAPGAHAPAAHAGEGGPH